MDCRVLLSLLALLLQLVGRLPYSYSQQPGDIRLTGYEASKTSGRLEMYLNNQWGSVCGYRFDRNVAGVACRQLGLGLPVEVVLQRFGVGSGPVAVGEFICEGSESHLLRCLYKQGTDLGMIQECQSHSHDVGIICASKVQSYEGSVRLVGGDYTSVGVAEVFLNEAWLPLCNNDITQTAIDAMCRQLGYTHAVSKTPKTFDSSDWAVVSSSCSSPLECLSSCLPTISTCVSNMATEVECGFTLSSTVTAGNRMLCTLNQATPPNMSVRINDGDVAEVYLASRGAWLRVCHNDEFDFQDADVLCKQVGESAARTVSPLVISSPASAVALRCYGTESRVSQCPPFSEIFNCDTVAVITCQSDVPPYGSLQLYNGAGSAGSLYLFDGSVTGPVCDAGFGANEAQVACRQLGYQDTDNAVAYSNAYYGDAPHNVIFISRSFNCSGNESHLLDCASVSIPFGSMCRSPYDIVGIKCGPTNSKDDTVRLVDTQANGSGVLEVMVDGKWRGVCGRKFSLLSGVVACRELGYASIESINFTSSTSPVVSSVSCAGWEEHLIDCPFSLNDCQDEIVTLECSSTLPTANGTLRLADNSTSPHSISGRLEVSYNGIWMSVCGLLLSEYAADTACKQLGYANASAYCTNACNGSSSGPVFFVEDHCTVGEDTLVQCMLDLHNQQFCSHDHDVGLTCAMAISDVSDPIVSPTSSIVPSSPSSSAAILSTGAPPVGSIIPQPPSSSSLPQYFIYAIGGGGALLASAVFVISVICCAWCCRRRKRGGVRENTQNSRNARLELRQQGNGVTRNGTLCSSGETSIADVKETSTDWKRQHEKLFPPGLTGYEDSASLNGGASPSFTFNGQELSEEPPRYEQLEFMSMPIASGKTTAKQDEEEPVKLDLQLAQPSSFTNEL